MRRKLTAFTLQHRAPETGRIEIRDADSRLILRISSSGARSFCVRSRVAGKVVRLTFAGPATNEELPLARKWANAIVAECEGGIDPRQNQPAEASEDVTAPEANPAGNLENVVARYVERRLKREKKNRSADEVEKLFARYVTPRWKERPMTSIRRRDVSALLDDIFDAKVVHKSKLIGGPVAADHVLAHLRSFFNWYATQDDDFKSPIVTGMARTSPRERARSRILSDDEIHVLWPLLANHGTYGAIIRLLLLTAQRRDEVSQMARSEIVGIPFWRLAQSSDAPLPKEAIWMIPATRYKTKRPNVVPLTAEAIEFIASQDVIDDSDLVFTTNGRTGFSGWSKCKRRLDADMVQALRKLAIDQGQNPSKVSLSEWRLHDLRRTAKTLMIRSGVRPDISERVLGHVIAGVEGIYDRHDYLAEKREALERLAREIRKICDCDADSRIAA
jgi:integrase